MGVDVGSLAFRALRIGEDGGLLSSPGADWSKAVSPIVDLLDLTELGAINDSDLINTDGVGTLLLHVQANLLLGSGRAAYLQVFNALGAATEQLVYSRPLNPTNQLHTHVVPTIGPRHFVRITLPAAESDRFLRVRFQRVPPGVPVASQFWTTQLATSTTLSALGTSLGTWRDPLNPSVTIRVAVEGVGGGFNGFWLEGRPYSGEVIGSLWFSLASREPTLNASHLLNTREGTSLFAIQNTASDNYLISVDIAPVRHT